MNLGKIIFDKQMTAIIKGFAIVFMIVLHVFGGPGWYEGDLPMNHNEVLLHFMGTFKICVGMFVFMVGYGYSFSKTKDFNYSFHHIKKLLSCFWLILFCFALPAGYQSLSGGAELINNMFGISSTLCWVSWFVYFYIWAMVIMPFAGRLIDRKPYFWTILLMIAAFTGMAAFHELYPGFSDNNYSQALFDCLLNSPLMFLGYFFGRKGLFETIRIPRHWSVAVASVVLSSVVLIAKANIGGKMAIVMELAYAPLMILGILSFFSVCKCIWLEKIMIELGDKSVYMWFFHALFFTAATRPIYGRFVLVSDNLWIIALWTIMLSYVCSRIIKKVIEY